MIRLNTLKNVVVTGVGVISSLGTNKDVFFNNLCLGKDASAKITSINTDGYRKMKAAEIKEKLEIPNEWKQYGRATQMALLAAAEAVEDSGLTQKLPLNTGVSIGTNNGNSYKIEAWYCDGKQKSLEEINEDLLQDYPLHSITQTISKEFGLDGLQNTVMTACVSGTSAIGIGLKWIRNGRADVVICGGAEAFRPLTHLGMTSFRVVASDAVKPFDKNRKGLLVGEGAGILVLESEEYAKKRDAKWHCYVAGFGASCDANDLAHPLDNGFGMALAMKKAMDEANINIDDVDYINAHGTATNKNDIAELTAVKELIGDSGKKVFVVSNKGAIGHTMGAAGGIEAVATVLSIKNKRIPPNINCENPENISENIIIPQKAVDVPIKVAISNSFGFGGNNSSIAFKEIQNG